MAGNKDKSPRFEEAVEELESIIDRIESGEIGLEECVVQYERGMKLAVRCREILDTVQKRIAELTKNTAGKLQAPGEDAPLDDAELDDQNRDENDDQP